MITKDEVEKARNIIKKFELQEKKGNIPKLNPNPDWTEVIRQAEEITQDVIDGNYHEDNDNNVYMMEAV